MRPKVKFEIPTAIIRNVYGLFLLSTGIMTFVGALRGLQLPGEGPQPPAYVFLQAVIQTGYLFHWVGIFKIIVGVLLLIPRTAPLGIIMTCGYSVNILLWVVFVAQMWLPLGVADFLASMFLVYAYFDYYKPIFGLFKEKQTAQQKLKRDQSFYR